MDKPPGLAYPIVALNTAGELNGAPFKLLDIGVRQRCELSKTIDAFLVELFLQSGTDAGNGRKIIRPRGF